MRLTDKEADVLAAVQLSAERAIGGTAAELGYRQHTVRYYLEQLKFKNIIQAYPYIDVSMMGLTRYFVLFTTASQSSSTDQAFLDHLVASPEVYWVMELGGDYQYACCLCAQNEYAVARFFDALADRFGSLFFEKSISSVVFSAIFGRKYLSKKVPTPKPILRTSSGESTAAVDEVDRMILSRLSQEAFSSWREFARLTGLPASTVDYRIKKLKSSRILLGMPYSINPAAYGMLQFRLMMYTRGFGSAFRERLYAFCAKHPNVVSFVHFLGDWDYDCRIEVADARDANAIRQTLYETFGRELIAVKVIPQFEELKFTMYPGLGS